MSRFSTFITVLACLLIIGSAQAQGGVDQPLQAVISGPTEVQVGRTLVLDASSSTGLPDEGVEYRWYREGVPQPISRSVEAVYTPLAAENTSIRLVVRRTVGSVAQESSVEHPLTVYERKLALIADVMVPPEKIRTHALQAGEQNVYLRVLRQRSSALPLAEDNALYTLIADNKDLLVGADAVILWADGISGLQSLQSAIENDQERLAAFANQAIILITDTSLQTLAKTARGTFSVLKPDRIIVTRKEAINPLIGTEDIDAFVSQLEQRDIDFIVVDKSSVAVRPWNLLSSLVNYMLTHGVSSRTIILLLSLPLIATMLAFLKQVIGITTFGLYLPSVIALSFLALGPGVGVAFLLFILVTGYAVRIATRRWRMLYIPKVAIVITVVSFTLLLLLGIGAYFGLTLSGDTIFILLIMSTLSESFLNLKAEEGLISAIIAIAETVLAALLCVFIVQWSMLQAMILAYPEWILLTLLVNAFLGRYTGLRLVEYFRFREVFKHLREE